MSAPHASLDPHAAALATGPAQLTQGTVTLALQQMKSALLPHLRSGAVLGVNMAALQQFDTSALAFMLDLQRWALAQQATVQWLQLPADVHKLADLYGLGQAFAAPSNAATDLALSAVARPH